MRGADRITSEVIQEFTEQAQARLGKDQVSADEFRELAESAEAQGRHYAAAVYYALAAIASLPSPLADRYNQQAQEMLWRVGETGGESRHDRG